MISRQLKLKLNKDQAAKLNTWLWNLTAVYNFGIRKIELNAKDKIYFSGFDFHNLLAGHSIKLEIPSHTLQGILKRAHNAWNRCFKKLSKKPRFKGLRNKLTSIPFPDPILRPKDKKIALPGLGKLKYFKQALPEGKIKCGAIIKRASGWYLSLTLDTDHTFQVKDTQEAIGIDPGFKTLLTLSNGIKIENPRELRKGAERLAQAQRGHNQKLASRLQEKQANRRKDRNHKISRSLVENFKTICYSNDSFKGLARVHGKSVSEAGLGQLIAMLTYKCRTGSRTLTAVNSRFTTMTCSSCLARTGPIGWAGLKVRTWDCGCGTTHDRDINAARNVLRAGLGLSHERSLL